MANWINISIQTPSGWSNVLANQIQQAASLAISSTLMVTKSRWEQIAQERLVTTRVDYILGLNADTSLQYPDAFTGVLTLRGKWPNMLETGFPAFDMKPGYAASQSKHLTKNGGWYVNIPFRHLTPDATGSGVKGIPMPEDIYARAQVLAANQRLTGTEEDYPPQTSWNGYEHVNGIYEDMKKVTKTYDKATQNHYMTWRRLSSDSDPLAFWHPGFEGIHAIDDVVPYARDMFVQVFTAYLQKLMG